MSDYDTYLEAFDKMSEEEMLQSLTLKIRHAMQAVTHNAELMNSLTAKLDASELPEHFVEDCESVLTNARRINQFLDSVYDAKIHQRLLVFIFDIRTPIQTVIGFAHLISHTIEEHDSSDLKGEFDDWCQLIKKDATKIHDMIDAARTSQIPPNIRQEREDS